MNLDTKITQSDLFKKRKLNNDPREEVSYFRNSVLSKLTICHL